MAPLWGNGGHASSLYRLAAAGGQVFERLFVQSQLLGLLALFCFLDVGHTSPSWLMSLFTVQKVCWRQELIRSGIAFGQRARPFLANELRLIKSGEEIVEHQLVRALRGGEQPIGLHVDQASDKFP